MKYDAILRHAYVGARIAIGDIYEDSSKRFPDGASIRTSTIQEVIMEDGVKYLKTHNTVYKVEEEK